MSRGRAIPDLHQHLFVATQRLLLRVGPSGLTSRAITDEAGCAKGILHNHFGDLDGFLAAFVADRMRLTMESADELRAMAGKGSVVTNLTDALVRLFGPGTVAVSRLLVSRPTLQARVQQERSEPVLDEVQTALAGYLDAEKKLGRVAVSTDIDMLAFTLFGSVHHLFFTNSERTPERDRVHSIVASLVTGPLPPDASATRITETTPSPANNVQKDSHHED